MPRPESKTIVLTVLYAALLALLFYVGVEQKSLPKEKSLAAVPKVESNYFEHIPIIAKAVYVLDTTDDKILYSKDARSPLPLASITKVMTAMCSLESLEGESIVLQDSDLLEDRGYLNAGESWKTSDLVSYMLIESSNDVAGALARAYGGAPAMTKCMNERAASLNLFSIKFANETGLDIGTSPGAYGSAEDAAKMFESAIKAYPRVFEKTSLKSYNIKTENGIMHTATNTDRAIGNISGLLASKTGYTDLAGGNLVFAMDAGFNHKIIIAILGSTEEGRFTDAAILSSATIQTLAENDSVANN